MVRSVAVAVALAGQPLGSVTFSVTVTSPPPSAWKRTEVPSSLSTAAFVSDHCRVAHDVGDVSYAVSVAPEQIDVELSEIVGAAGAATTVTWYGCEVALQPFASVAVTQYEVVCDGESVNKRVVAPLDH